MPFGYITSTQTLIGKWICPPSGRAAGCQVDVGYWDKETWQLHTGTHVAQIYWPAVFSQFIRSPNRCQSLSHSHFLTHSHTHIYTHCSWSAVLFSKQNIYGSWTKCYVCKLRSTIAIFDNFCLLAMNQWLSDNTSISLTNWFMTVMSYQC